MYEKFERLLNETGVTAYRVCKDLGLSFSTTTEWKQGKYTPKADTIMKICDYFGVPITYFYGD